MSSRNLEFLRDHLSRGDCFLGQVRIGTGHVLCHREDALDANCAVFTNPHDAIALARYDDAGKFRPLKTAPNLRHGWRLELSNLAEVLLALDFLYPAAAGTARILAESALPVFPLRSTLDRQTGMYAVTKKITDEQAAEVIKTICDPEKGCLRRILWPISPETPSPRQQESADIATQGQEIPLLCAEACNLFVAAARGAVKAAAAQAS